MIRIIVAALLFWASLCLGEDEVEALPFPPDLESDAMHLINQHRNEAGCPALKLEEVLYHVSISHSSDQARSWNVGHEGSDGSSFSERAERAGYDGFVMGENVAGGQSTAEDVVRSWMGSDAHKGILLNCEATHGAVGYYRNLHSDIKHYWTLMVGNIAYEEIGDSVLSGIVLPFYLAVSFCG